ncbi:hypothetical protein NQ176_g11049 [Zarea fungicola]|uniref:Uncharacterized protein n=1 Tax=Zarea fungicola TaxID=93591 RepID=A0ACC1MDE5_9HYPO|nr:hypothetical protein NQ176_g11049 [Lecanicillium fungicola]
MQQGVPVQQLHTVKNWGLANLWRQHQPIAPNNIDAQVSASVSAPASHHVSPISTNSPQGTDASHESEGNHLRQRIRELEEQLSKVNLKYTGDGDHLSVCTTSLETATSKIGGVFHLMCDTPMAGTGPGIARTLMHKSRMFGQSHWCVATVIMIRDVFEMIDSRLQEVGATAWAGIAKCKALARFIKARRTPAWPTLKSSPLPDKAMADVLVENYLQTTESLYRILHIPTFREHYNALWGDAAPQNPAFIIQVKLVLALGAVTYDDLFTLRETALQWVFEAKTWLATGPRGRFHVD